MKPVEFLFNIIDRFSPMNEQDKVELRQEAHIDYLKVKKQVFDEKGDLLIDKKTATLKQKLVIWGEYWPVRMALALLFIPMVRWVQDYMNPPEEIEDEE